jgi:hypothetical protein
MKVLYYGNEHTLQSGESVNIDIQTPGLHHIKIEKYKANNLDQTLVETVKGLNTPPNRVRFVDPYDHMFWNESLNRYELNVLPGSAEAPFDKDFDLNNNPTILTPSWYPPNITF